MIPCVKFVKIKGRYCCLQKNNKKGKFNWMNIILSNIKASLYGTFHSIDYERYGDRYLAALQYCFNRRFDLNALFYGLVSSAAQSPQAIFHKAEALTG